MISAKMPEPVSRSPFVAYRDTQISCICIQNGVSIRCARDKW